MSGSAYKAASSYTSVNESETIVASSLLSTSLSTNSSAEAGEITSSNFSRSSSTVGFILWILFFMIDKVFLTFGFKLVLAFCLDAASWSYPAIGFVH